MITLVASTRRATAVSDDAITTRSVGIPVTLDLSEHFGGLSVTLVCKAGEVSRDIAVLDPDALEVPVDCLQVAGVPLLLGLVGKNAAGTIVIRTIMASAGTIRVGTEESDVDPSDPVPDWTVQVQQWAEDAHDTAERLAAEVDGWETAIDAAVEGAENVDATVSKSGDTATISVTDRTGVRHTATVRDGATGPAGADGYSPTATVEQLADGATISITDKDGTTTATIHDGADGATGPEGPAGYSPSARVTQTASGATITVTDQSGTTTADISNGAPGEPGQTGPIGPTGEDGFSPTVDVQAITGGHEVTITDADGAHSFDVMDGDHAEPGSITDEMLAPDGIKPQVAQLFGNQLTGELSGTIDTAADAYAAPPMALSVDGNSTQAGTPTPDAPVPILSVDDLSLVLAGKNLVDAANPAASVLATYTYENDTLTVTATNANTWCYLRYRVSAVEWMQGQSVTLSTIASATGTPFFGIEFYKADASRISFAVSNTQAITRTVPNDTSYINVLFYARNTQAGAAGDTATYRNIQLELGSTTTAYEPYVGITIPDLLPEGTPLRSLPDGTRDTLNLSYLRPSTRAGWAWYSREVVQRTQAEDMSTVIYTYSGGFFRLWHTSMKVATTSGQALFRCESLAVLNSVTKGWFESNAADNSIAPIYGQSFKAEIRADAYSTIDELKAALAGSSLVYPLATPVTTQLDPIELPTLPAPTATVWCDGGSATPTYQMGYVRDTNLVVQQLEAAIADLATS